MSENIDLIYYQKKRNVALSKAKDYYENNKDRLREQARDKYIKTKIKTHKDNVTTNFHNKNDSKKIPEENVPHKCLSIIILDSVIYAYKKYHSQIFLDECKYAKENIKTKNYIDEELKSEFDIDTDANTDNDINTDIDIEE